MPRRLPRLPRMRRRVHSISPACSMTAFAAGLLLYAGSVPCRSEQPSIAVERFLSMRTMRSPSGRFTVHGTNALQVSDLARWGDGVAKNLEHLLGAVAPPGRDPARLVLTEDPSTTSGWVRVVAQTPAPQLLIANYGTVDVAEVGRTLVGGLLADFSTWGASQRVDAVPSPEWLVSGVMRNMDSGLREADYASVFSVWRQGGVPPLAECLSSLVSSGAVDNAMAGVLVQWMLSLKEEGACLRTAIRRASGGAVPRPEWFFEFAGCATPADLESAWERWLVDRQWVIGSPGKGSGWMLERIRGERLLYPTDSGIPNGKPGDPPLTMADLVRERKFEWARTAAASRAVRLRLLAAGRASEAAEVLGAYSQFLEAVRDGSSESELNRMLAVADGLFAALESRESGLGDGTNSLPSPERVNDRGMSR